MKEIVEFFMYKFDIIFNLKKKKKYNLIAKCKFWKALQCNIVSILSP